MSNPSFSNIDRWLFELSEGNLSAEQIAQLESFLMRHPELDVDKDVWMQAKVEQQDYIYPNQHKLIRRRPIGLYSVIGFATIMLLMSLSIYTSTNSDYYQDVELSRTEINTPNSYFALHSTASKFYVGHHHVPNTENQTVNTFIAQTTITNRRIESSNLESRSSNNLKSFQYNRLPSETKANNELIDTEYAFTNENVQLADEVINDLAVVEATPIEYQVTNSESDNKSARTGSSVRFAKSDYKVTFGSRMHKFGRDLQRMLDNPIALRNQRDPYYHVPGMQAMDVNFSSVGTMLATRVQATARTQWLGSQNQQYMSQFSVDGYSYGIRGGLGFQMIHNYYGNGEIQNYTAALTYSPKFSVSRGVTVEPSLRFKMGSKMLDSDNIVPGTKVEYDRSSVQEFLMDGSAPIGRQLWYKDLGLGLMVNTKWFYAGIQGDNLFNHYDNIYSNSSDNLRRVGTHFVATIGTDYQSVKKTVMVSPYIVYQQQEQLKEAWLGANLRLKWLTIGAAISSNLEPAASLGMKFQHFALTYNADYTQSALLNQQSLSHQLTIRFVTKPSRIGQRLLN